MIVVISQNELIPTKNHFIVKLINVVIKYVKKSIKSKSKIYRFFSMFSC